MTALKKFEVRAAADALDGEEPSTCTFVLYAVDELSAVLACGAFSEDRGCKNGYVDLTNPADRAITMSISGVSVKLVGEDEVDTTNDLAEYNEDIALETLLFLTNYLP